jgi:hypothetical protein
MTFHATVAAFGIAGALACATAWADQDPPAPVWVEQAAKSDDHVFSVRLLQYEQGDGEYLSAATALRIVDRKSGAVVQQIDAINGMEMRTEPQRFVRLVDANGDGHPDIELSYADGGAGPNNTSYYYLYDRKARQYRFHKKLSEMTQVSVNADGTITSGSRGGCCQHSSETYRFIRGRLTLLKTWQRTLTPDDMVEVVTGTLRNGKMRYKTTRQKAPREN